MGIFGTPKAPTAPKAAPVTPRLSDQELLARDEMNKTRKRTGINDQILSLGRSSTSPSDNQQYSSLLGRAAA